MFFLIFGLAWTLIPLMGFLGMLFSDEPMDNALFIILPIFFIFGCFFLYGGIKAIIREKKLKKLAKIGKDAIGKYIYHASNVTQNDNPLYYIEFSYVNDKGEYKEIKTPTKYHAEEAYYYSKVGQFKIRYDDTDAVIVQPVDHTIASQMRLEMFGNAIHTLPINNGHAQPVEKEQHYVCSYCGNIQKKPDKCNCCGATSLKKRTLK